MHQHQIRRGEQWLLHSGIQSYSGGFHGWYDIESQSYPFLYSEATGYAVSFLVKIGEIERATRATEWLIREAYLKDRAFRSYFYYREGMFRPSMYSFDNAVCLKALLDLHQETKKHQYLEYAVRIGDWLLKMQEPNGRFRAVFPPQESSRWSVHPGCYHAKNAVALLQLSKVTGEAQYEGSAHHVLEWVSRRQRDNGSFPVQQLHPHCYAAEGLLYAGKELENLRYVDAAKKAIIYFLNQPILIRPDVLAQTVCLSKEMDLVCADVFMARLLRHQCRSEDQRADGGFLFNKKHVNSWTTMFALEAMRKWLR